MLYRFLLYVNFDTLYGYTLYVCGLYHLIRMTGFWPGQNVRYILRIYNIIMFIAETQCYDSSILYRYYNKM